MEINWKDVQDNLCPKLSLHDLAGLSPSMWSHVRHGRRKFGPAAQFRLLFKLAQETNFEGKGEVLHEAEQTILALAKELSARFPGEE